MNNTRPILNRWWNLKADIYSTLLCDKTLESDLVIGYRVSSQSLVREGRLEVFVWEQIGMSQSCKGLYRASRIEKEHGDMVGEKGWRSNGYVEHVVVVDARWWCDAYSILLYCADLFWTPSWVGGWVTGCDVMICATERWKRERCDWIGSVRCSKLLISHVMVDKARCWSRLWVCLMVVHVGWVGSDSWQGSEGRGLSCSKNLEFLSEQHLQEVERRFVAGRPTGFMGRSITYWGAFEAGRQDGLNDHLGRISYKLLIFFFFRSDFQTHIQSMTVESIAATLFIHLSFLETISREYMSEKLLLDLSLLVAEESAIPGQFIPMKMTRPVNAQWPPTPRSHPEPPSNDTAI